MQKQILIILENFSLYFYVDIEKIQYTKFFVNINRKVNIKPREGVAEAFLMDLSKACDTISHERLITKLHAYGFYTEALKVLLSSLQER